MSKSKNSKSKHGVERKSLKKSITPELNQTRTSESSFTFCFIKTRLRGLILNIRVKLLELSNFLLLKLKDLVLDLRQGFKKTLTIFMLGLPIIITVLVFNFLIHRMINKLRPF